MKAIVNKSIVYTLAYFLVTLALTLPEIVWGQQSLSFMPLLPDTGLSSGGGGFSVYINNLYYLSIGLAALLAVIKITIAGVKWMLSDIVTDKSQAKKDIWGAVIGLLIIISAFLILNTINAELVNVTFNAERLENLGGGTIDFTPIAPGVNQYIPCEENLTSASTIGGVAYDCDEASAECERRNGTGTRTPAASGPVQIACTGIE